MITTQSQADAHNLRVLVDKMKKINQSDIPKPAWEDAPDSPAPSITAPPACFDDTDDHFCAKAVKIVISGQIRGGKNNMIVTRSGLHFPKPEWAKWRDEAVARVKSQLPKGFKPFALPINCYMDYVAGDRRRRDQPAIMDSIFHVLEKAGVVTDDTLIWVTGSHRAYDKANPRCELILSADSAPQS